MFLFISNLDAERIVRDGVFIDADRRHVFQFGGSGERNDGQVVHAQDGQGSVAQDQEQVEGGGQTDEGHPRILEETVKKGLF